MIESHNLIAFRCKLCQEAILSVEKPMVCPFCGAHGDYVTEASKWKDENAIKDLSIISKDNLEKALRAETDNVKFYHCACSYSMDMKNKSIFQALLKIKTGHILAISKLLRRSSENEMAVQDICFRLDSENIKNAISREEKTKEFYSTAFNEAIEPRVKEVFFGLIEVGNDHIEMLKNL